MKWKNNHIEFHSLNANTKLISRTRGTHLNVRTVVLLWKCVCLWIKKNYKKPTNKWKSKQSETESLEIISIVKVDKKSFLFGTVRKYAIYVYCLQKLFDSFQRRKRERDIEGKKSVMKNKWMPKLCSDTITAGHLNECSVRSGEISKYEMRMPRNKPTKEEQRVEYTTTKEKVLEEAGKLSEDLHIAKSWLDVDVMNKTWISSPKKMQTRWRNSGRSKWWRGSLDANSIGRI